MRNGEIQIIYEDEDVLAIDKPAGIVCFPGNQPSDKDRGRKNLIDYLLEKIPDLKNIGEPPRYGIVHRLDKDTSGILLVAKNNKALESFQKQFQENRTVKKYLALVVGKPKNDEGVIETLIGRSPKNRLKQKVYLPAEPGAEGKRRAITKYKVLGEFFTEKKGNYSLVEVSPKTGRKHQIRVHFSYLGHPVAGDKLYGFKGQLQPKGISRQFLHAYYLKVTLPDGQVREFHSDLAEDLKNILKSLKIYDDRS